MADDLQLQIQSGAGTFTFDVGPQSWEHGAFPSFKAAANPPELEQIIYEWVFSGCRLRSSDGTQETLWDEYQAFLAFYETRANFPTRVVLVRDPTGANVTEMTLGGSPDYENFRVEAVEGAPDPRLPRATNRQIMSLTIRVTALKVFADANGIVSFAQEQHHTSENGLSILEWVTSIQTAEGTSAVTAALNFAKIDIANFSAFYAYDTNNANGIDYTVEDSDEVNSRVPTAVVAVSRIREFGEATFGSTSGNGVNFGTLTTSTTKEAGVEEIVYSANAEGPGALTWVRARRPGGAFIREIEFDDPYTNQANATWVRRVESVTSQSDTKKQTDDVRSEIKVTYSRGGQIVRWEPVPGGFPALKRLGPYTELVARVAIRLRRLGGSGRASALPFPRKLDSPWDFIPDESSESEPYISKPGTGAETDEWTREATWIFKTANVWALANVDYAAFLRENRESNPVSGPSWLGQ